jgi:predicted RNase H-like nuclease
MPPLRPAITHAPHAIGIDGCRGGWVVASCDDDAPGSLRFEVHAALAFLRDSLARRICIDMPIGLSRTPRTCDALFRRALPGAASRVFSPPCREVLGCATWTEANAISKRLTGKGLSQQAFNIMPKIREVDELLASVPRLRGVVREVHPEVLFAKRVGRVLVSKKSAHGVAERVAIIASDLGVDEARIRTEAARLRRAGSQLDDVLDAAMALVVARAPEASIRSLPQPPEHDERGLAMEMIYIDARAHTDPT